MVSRTGDSEIPKKRTAMRRFLPFAALALMLGTLAAPLVDVGVAAAAAPTASTSAATSVTGTTATLNGTVNGENNNPAVVTFCYSTTSLTNCTGGDAPPSTAPATTCTAARTPPRRRRSPV